jgi:putative NAD(P)H nitroreductase
MEAVNLIMERRSINFFDRDFELADDKLRELIALANLCPSSMNMQPWRVIAVKSPERKKALRALAFNQPKVEEASVVLIIIADPELLEANMGAVLSNWAKLGYLKEEAIENMKNSALLLYSDKESMRRKIFAVKNSSLFAMSVMFAAKALGIESHPMDGFEEEKVKKEFGIEERAIVPMLIAVGQIKPGTKLLPRAMRRPVGEFVRFE